MVWEEQCFGQIMDTNTKGKIAHLSYRRWAFFHSPRIFERQALVKQAFWKYDTSKLDTIALALELPNFLTCFGISYAIFKSDLQWVLSLTLYFN